MKVEKVPSFETKDKKERFPFPFCSRSKLLFEKINVIVILIKRVLSNLRFYFLKNFECNSNAGQRNKLSNNNRIIRINTSSRFSCKCRSATFLSVITSQKK